MLTVLALLKLTNVWEWGQNQAIIAESTFHAQGFQWGAHLGLNSYLHALYNANVNRKFVAICGTLFCDTTSRSDLDSESDGMINPPHFYRFKAGVAGLANEDIAVYGANRSALPVRVGGTYAGYFDGDVNITGTLSVPTISTTSDYRLKQDIRQLNEAGSFIDNLHPVSFHFKSDTTVFGVSAKSQRFQTLHYGLVAQDVQKVLPDIVYENQDGYLSINYIEIIPLLIQSAKDFQEENRKLNDRIESLEQQIQYLSNNPSKVKGKSEISDEIEAKLYQNQPNPFSQSTEIKYSLPIETTSATLYIYDMSGVQLRSYPISKFGDNSLTINANDLTAGMYLYSLIADGQVIDTKRMILTK